MCWMRRLQVVTCALRVQHGGIQGYLKLCQTGAEFDRDFGRVRYQPYRLSVIRRSWVDVRLLMISGEAEPPGS